MKNRLSQNPQLRNQNRFSVLTKLILGSGLLAGIVLSVIVFSRHQSMRVMGTNYYTVANGNWSSGATWSSPPPDPLPSGDSLFIRHNVTFDVDYGVDGSMIVSKRLIGGNDLYINAGGYLENNDSMNVEKIVNRGIVINNGGIYNNNELDNEKGTFTNAGYLNINNVLKNNSGSFVNSGTLDIGDKVENLNGTLSNSGTIDVGKEFINKDGGSLKNYGTITITDYLDNENGGNILNDGTLTVGDDLKNKDGTITNNQMITVTGNLLAESNSLLNGSGGFYDVCGSLDMFSNAGSVITGSVTVCKCDGMTDPIVNRGTVGGSVQVCSPILPVSLSALEGTYHAGSNDISWSAIESSVGISYQVERSQDGVIFEILNLIAGIGDPHSHYTYTDHAVERESLYYYRIAMIDIDGYTTYSHNIEVNALPEETRISFRLWPSPAMGKTVNVSIHTGINGPLQVTWLDLSGRQVWENHYAEIPREFTIDIPPVIANGTYFIRLSDSKQNYSSQKLILLR